VLTPRELRIRYRQSVLDIAWALISPLAILVVYGVVLTQSFDVDAGCGPYLSSAWTGLVIWTFFATAVGTAAVSLISSGDLITKVYFPREALPLAMVGASLADLAIGLLTLAVLLPVQGVTLHPVAVTAVLPIAVIVVWSTAISVFVAVVAAFIRDVPHAVQLLLRVGFFATPVMYEASFLPAGLQWTASVSPVAASITGLRDALLCGQVPDVPVLLTHLVVGIALVIVAVAYTRSVETRITDVV
jgi:ABC-type polysaccharide/polyol phosphate export permease